MRVKQKTQKEFRDSHVTEKETLLRIITSSAHGDILLVTSLLTPFLMAIALTVVVAGMVRASE